MDTEIERYVGDDFMITMHRISTYGGTIYAWSCDSCRGDDGGDETKSRMDLNAMVDKHRKLHEGEEDK